MDPMFLASSNDSPHFFLVKMPIVGVLVEHPSHDVTLFLGKVRRLAFARPGVVGKRIKTSLTLLWYKF